MSDYDPPPPPEGGSGMRATDLVNKVCIFRTCSTGEWPAKEAADGQPARKAQPYVECDVWVLDRAGILEEGTGVRVSWFKVYDQLAGGKDARPIGSFTTGMPQQEEGGKAIVLTKLVGDAAAVANRIVPELESKSAADDFVDGSEPF